MNTKVTFMVETVIAELLGYTATVLSIVAFFPQVYKTWKTKTTRDISLPMYLIFTTSSSYGLSMAYC